MKLKPWLIKPILPILIGTFIVAGVISASTTIGNNISTTGTLTVTGTSTLGQLYVNKSGDDGLSIFESTNNSELFIKTGDGGVSRIRMASTTNKGWSINNNSALNNFFSIAANNANDVLGLTTDGKAMVNRAGTNPLANLEVGGSFMVFPDRMSASGQIFYVGSDGKVGIGTSTVSDNIRLEVSGNSIFNGMGIFRDDVMVNNTDSAIESSLRIDGTYNNTSAARLEIHGTTSRIMFVGGESEWPTTWTIGLNTELSSNPNSDFKITNVSSGLNSFVIKKANNFIGIGTSTPEDNLDVNGKIGLTGSLRLKGSPLGIQFEKEGVVEGLLQLNDNNQIQASNLRILSPGSGVSLISDGRVGIGTSTPDANLQVYGGDTATSTVEIGGSASAKGACLKLRDSDGAGWTYCTTLDGTLSCSTTSCE